MQRIYGTQEIGGTSVLYISAIALPFLSLREHLPALALERVVPGRGYHLPSIRASRPRGSVGDRRAHAPPDRYPPSAGGIIETNGRWTNAWLSHPIVG